MSTIYTFISPEMHCGACELIVERTLGKDGSVRSVKADAKRSTVVVETDLGVGPEEMAVRFAALLQPKGYTIAVRQTVPNKSSVGRDLVIALLFAFAVVAGFVALQKVGLVNLFTPNEVNLPAAFLIGVIASLSTCMALVGGLLLSVAANVSRADAGSRVLSNTLFHVGRLVSFFFLGGLIGTIGKAFTLTPLLTVALNAAVALVMLLLGFNLLDLFPTLKRFQLRLPSSLSRRLLKADGLRHSLAPALLGLITFFLPCGFTQSMQLFALSSGNFLKGGLTMLAFAAGTLPVLVTISVASVNFAASPRSGIFFKAAGMIVIAFALFNLLNSLAVLGVIRPLVGV